MDASLDGIAARAFVIDTNVVVAGLLTRAVSPTAQVLDGMLEGSFPFLLSADLLAEYREVLLRPRIQARHGLVDEEVDALLTHLAANAIVREPQAADERAPSRQDQHLWDLLATESRTVLVTGDRRLLAKPPRGAAVVAPAELLK